MLLLVELNELDYIELALWIASIIVIFIVGILFLKDRKKNLNFLIFSLFFFLFIPARLCRLIVKFIVGQAPIGEAPTGEMILYYVGYTCFSYIGLFFIYFAIERMIVKKSHYIFSILVAATTVLSVINYFPFNCVFLILMPLYVVVLFGLPGIFLNLAYKSSGIVRRNALIIVVGILMFEFGIVFDIPEAREIWIGVPDIILKFGAPLLQIFGTLLIRKGFPKDVY